MKRMASLPTGSDTLLKIRTQKIDFVIKSKGRQTGTVFKTGDRSSSLKVVGLNLEEVSVPVQGIGELYTEHAGFALQEYNVSPLFFEQTDYEIIVRARNKESLEFRSKSSLIEERVNPLMEGDNTLLSGIINYGNNVGFSDFDIYADGREILFVRVEVYPTKISYKKDYQDMMADINNMISECVLDFMRKTYQVFVPDHKRNEVPAVFFTILEAVFDKYMKAANRIIAVPHHKLITEHELVPHYKARRTDSKSEKWLRKHSEYIRRTKDGLQVEKILAVRKQITYDTQENRLVKFMLKTTVRKIEDFARRYRNCRQQPDEKILGGAARMVKKIRQLLSTTFLEEVSDYNASKSMSLVFGMAPGYRELYKYYLMMQNGISAGGEIFQMSVRETAQIYEYWCFIKLFDILRSRYTLKSPDIIKVDKKGVTVDLVKGRASKATFLNTKTGERIYLSYNPSEVATQTVNQRPDNVLELEKKGSESHYKYIFDAKYRIETNPEGQFYPDTKPGPKVDDINTMHRYRDSIVYANPKSRFTFEKTMFGAYILFPYTEEEEYKEHQFFKSIDTVNIGGLPFLPSATKLVQNLLDELVADSPESAFERATLPAGIEERLKSVDWNKRDVLIGFVPDKNHLNIFLEHNIYFTRKFDKDNMPIRYVALYEKGQGIYRYGEVINWEEKIPKQVPGSSMYANTRCHVFGIKKWHSLKTPISVSESGPNPVAYTNFFLLSNSDTYPELFLKSEADYRFFIELKRRTDERIIKEVSEDMVYEFGAAKVMINRSDINVYLDGKEVKVCTVEEFSKQPRTLFKRIQKYAEKKY